MPRAEDVIPLPDFRGIAGRVQQVSDLLEQGQGQLVYFENLRIGSCHKPSDPILLPPGVTEGPTYAEREQQLKEGIAALWKKNADIADELRIEAAKRRKAFERYHEQDDGTRRYATAPSY